MLGSRRPSQITETVISRTKNPLHVRGLEFIHHTLAADLAATGQPTGATPPTEVGPPERATVDVERLLAALELLIDRRSQPWSPFVASWIAGLESFSAPSGLRDHIVASDLRGFEQALAKGFAPPDLDSRGARAGHRPNRPAMRQGASPTRSSAPSTVLIRPISVLYCRRSEVKCLPRCSTSCVSTDPRGSAISPRSLDWRGANARCPSQPSTTTVRWRSLLPKQGEVRHGN